MYVFVSPKKKKNSTNYLKFFFRMLNILIHTKEREEGFKKTNSDVYSKRFNSWIHNTPI